MLNIKVKRLNDKAIIPSFAHNTDACFDVYCTEDVWINPYKVEKVNIGLAMQPPCGYMLQVLSRSGLASKGTVVVGGIIDESYRGEIIVMLHNTTDEIKFFKAGSKIAQIALRKYNQCTFTVVDELNSTDRGDDGFGSTGV